MSFLTAFVTQKVKETQGSLEQLAVTLDPSSASQAQVTLISQELAKTNQSLASLQANVQDARKKVEADNLSIHQHLDAVDILCKQGKEDKATALLDEVEHELKPAMERDRQQLVDIEHSIQVCETRRAEITAKLRTSQANLDDARREMERAKVEKTQAQEALADAQRASGVDKSVDRMAVASTAMAQAARKQHEEAVAMRLQAESLGKVGPLSKSADGDVQAALAQASGKASAPTLSLAERMAAMRANMDDAA